MRCFRAPNIKQLIPHPFEGIAGCKCGFLNQTEISEDLLASALFCLAVSISGCLPSGLFITPTFQRSNVFKLSRRQVMQLIVELLRCLGWLGIKLLEISDGLIHRLTSCLLHRNCRAAHCLKLVCIKLSRTHYLSQNRRSGVLVNPATRKRLCQCRQLCGSFPRIIAGQYQLFVIFGYLL
ncbi:hypothetical protein D3C72_898710 [compost metagenome]